jgi:hypothetical protein
MQRAPIATTIRDPRLGVTFRVWAYRSLSEAEMQGQWLRFVAQYPKKIQRAKVYELNTIIGFNGR